MFTNSNQGRAMNRPESLKYEKVAQEAWRDLGSCLESCVKATIGYPQHRFIPKSSQRDRGVELSSVLQERGWE